MAPVVVYMIICAIWQNKCFTFSAIQYEDLERKSGENAYKWSAITRVYTPGAITPQLRPWPMKYCILPILIPPISHISHLALARDGSAVIISQIWRLSWFQSRGAPPPPPPHLQQPRLVAPLYNPGPLYPPPLYHSAPPHAVLLPPRPFHHNHAPAPAWPQHPDTQYRSDRNEYFVMNMPPNFGFNGPGPRRRGRGRGRTRARRGRGAGPGRSRRRWMCTATGAGCGV